MVSIETKRTFSLHFFFALSPSLHSFFPCPFHRHKAERRFVKRPCLADHSTLRTTFLGQRTEELNREGLHAMKKEALFPLKSNSSAFDLRRLSRKLPLLLSDVLANQISSSKNHSRFNRMEKLSASSFL